MIGFLVTGEEELAEDRKTRGGDDGLRTTKRLVEKNEDDIISLKKTINVLIREINSMDTGRKGSLNYADENDRHW